MTKDEALKLALEALEANQPVNYCMNSNGERFPMMHEDPFRFERNTKAITAIKEALAQPEQKSVAMAEHMALTEKYVALKAAQPEQERFLVATIGNWGRVEWVDGVFPSLGDKMYSAPRTWVGLTEDEVALIVADCSLVTPSDFYFAQTIEAKLKEKNT